MYSNRQVPANQMAGSRPAFLFQTTTTYLILSEMAEPEDILNDALSFIGEEQVIDSEILYGPLRLTVAPKVCKECWRVSTVHARSWYLGRQGDYGSRLLA